MKLPEKVRVGETLSARWLNQVVDCLKELAKAAKLSGNGSSTSSIEYSGSDMRDTKYRGTDGADLQEFRVVPFQLRLKPKHLCEAGEDGNWPKIAQMKAGAILDYMGKTHPVPKDAAIYDFTEGWVDIGECSGQLQKAYCIIKQNYKGEIISAEIKKDEAKFVPWGKTGKNAKGDGVLSVFIGSYQLRKIQEVNRAHIYQAHCGTLDLQTVQVEKLFDADEELQDDNASGEGESGYDTAPESGEYESEPASLFRKRDGQLLIFKKLICCEGLRLTDGKNLKVKLRRANSVGTDGSGSQESLEEGEPAITLGGVEDIVFDSGISSPRIESGIIKIPLADTLKEATGAVSGLQVSYVPAMLEDDGTVTFLGEDGSRLPQGAAAQAEGGSGSGDGPYINRIVEGVIYIAIPIFVDAPSASLSMSASESGSESGSMSESVSASASASDVGSEPGSASGSSSNSTSGSDSASGSSSASGSIPGSADASIAGSSPTEASASTEGSTPSGSSSVGGGSSSGSGGGSGDGSHSPGPVCDCADKLKALEERIASLEARVAALEAESNSGSSVDSNPGDSSPGGCNCQCGDVLAQIQAAIAAEAQAIANSINYEISVNGAVVTTTEYGTIVADATGSVSASGGNASSSIHYE